jgi:hypothetical protein
MDTGTCTSAVGIFDHALEWVAVLIHVRGNRAPPLQIGVLRLPSSGATNRTSLAAPLTECFPASRRENSNRRVHLQESVLVILHPIACSKAMDQPWWSASALDVPPSTIYALASTINKQEKGRLPRTCEKCTVCARFTRARTKMLCGNSTRMSCIQIKIVVQRALDQRCAFSTSANVWK